MSLIDALPILANPLVGGLALLGFLSPLLVVIGMMWATLPERHR